MKRLTLADILVTVLISFIFGIIYKMVGLTVAALKPLGLHLDQIAYGLSRRLLLFLSFVNRVLPF